MNISVVIPTFNRSHTLKRALDSVLNQTLPAQEVIIIDDGSTDNTGALIQSYQDSLVPIRYFKKDNAGVSSARNLGIEKAVSEWVSFLDSDDEWLPQKLEKQVEFIEQNPGYKAVHGEEVWIRNGVRVNPHKKHKKYGGRIFKNCLPLCAISPSTIMIHKSVLEKTGLFRTDYPACEDYDLWLKLTCQYEVGFIEIPIIKKYGGHADQLSHQFKAMDAWRVQSLHFILQERSQFLNSEELALTQEVLLKKAEILIKGYEKHGHQDKAQEMRDLCDLYNHPSQT